MYTGLLHTHRLLAYLLLFSTTISVCLAFASALSGGSPRLAGIGATLARKVELSLGGLSLVFGVAMWVMLRWPLTTWWLWAGVVAVAAQGMIVARGIKPATTALVAGDTRKKWLWVGWSIVHWGWITGIFYIMQTS